MRDTSPILLNYSYARYRQDVEPEGISLLSDVESLSSAGANTGW